jgi:excisionase family DNA binding protein
MLTVQDAAEKIGCHPVTIRRAIRSGDLQAMKLTPTSSRSQYRIRPDDLERWVLRSSPLGKPFAERLNDC